MALGLGLGISRGAFVSSVTLGQTIATTHYNRVIADGGVLPAGISGLGSVLDSVIAAYGVTSSADFNTKVPVFLDPQYTGYKLGAGAGTTLGQAAQKVYAISSSADVTQSTAASQPLLLDWSGNNYWWSGGVAGNYCSTPSNVANEITGDIEFIAKVNFQDSGNQDTIFIKSDAVASTFFCYSFWKNGDDLALTYSNSGAVAARVTSISSRGLSSVYTYGTDIWVKANRSAATGNVRFYYGSNGTTWTQLGTTQSTTPETIYNASIALWVGDWANILFQFKGKIYRATISDTIGGSPVVDFNPSEYSAASSQTDWNSNTGETWTINTGTAATGYKGCVVSKTIVMGDGIDDRISTGTLTSLSPWSIYTAYKSLSSSGSFLISDKNIFNETIFATNTSTSFLNGGVNLSGDALLRMIYGEMNQSNPKASVNNAALSTGPSPYNLANTGLNLFTSQNLAGFSNALINTVVLVPQADNSTTRTALYNIIRSMNNSSF